FCRACGHQLADPVPASPVTASTAPAGGQAPVAERRGGSVLFCGVAGGAPPWGGRGRPAGRGGVWGGFLAGRRGRRGCGGVVGGVIGGAVMAVWGTPVAAEGDAERAVRAGLDLVAAVADLGAEAGVPGLAARCGVVTGEVAVTLGVVGEGMVAGDAVNTAARVQSAA